MAAALLFALRVPSMASPDKPDSDRIPVLIVDGRNNHDWAKSTPLLKSDLVESGLFRVDVATAPADDRATSRFLPDFSKYKAVVLNYTDLGNGGEWPDEARKAFVNYVDTGGGVVVFHAASSAFPNWKEFNEITGLGGWGGRDERSGPYVYFKNGTQLRDASPGPGGHHGQPHPFRVMIVDPDHPITRGLPASWMHPTDELYDSLRGPARNLTILATAYSDPATGGTGQDEPVLFTVRYGRGRVFQTTLGHDASAMNDIGFIVTLQRGTEWAATGNVTQKVPKNFSLSSGGAPSPSESAAGRAPLGKVLFQQKCGFCHGMDGSGGEGPDLLHSSLVLHDETGSLIGPLVGNGRPDKGMPAFQLSGVQIQDIAAFLHGEILADATIFYTDSTSGYSLQRLLVGNAEAGKAFFNGPGKCSECHSPVKDLAHIASKYKPFDLQTRIAFPSGAKPIITVTQTNGTRTQGEQVQLDPFFVSLRDSNGWTLTWPRRKVRVEVHDPLAEHRTLLARYIDDDIHNLFAYLETLQ